MKNSTEYKMTHKKDFGHEKIEILYEDQWIVVINKPSGILSCPYPGSHSRTAQSVLEEIMRKKGTLNSRHKPYVVHRLDRDTSGVMMFALTETAQKVIMDTWHQMVTERLYRAMAENPAKAAPLPDSGLIDAPLAFNAYNVGFVPKAGDKPGRAAGKHEESVYEKHLGGKGSKQEFKTVPARTHYKVITRGKAYTLFELSLDTGKKNQIRAHLASKGYPLAGDENFRAKSDPFVRLCLHARTLEFDHPYTEEHMKFEVPEPAEWNDFVLSEKSAKVAQWLKPDAGSSHHRQNDERVRSDSGNTTRMTGKQKNHMDFIQKGKNHGR
ncbi:MAG: RluA family pseudouridine synthase [Treponema sp.]|nr:RluA family pseudouridine synthase [Treponema sp.]